MKMKIAVAGNGNLGRQLAALGAIPMSCNILKEDEIKREIKKINPDVIINAAGISSPDECERDYNKALAVNTWGHNKLCEVAGDGKIILISSEQVFDGTKGNYREDDDPAPINSYGFTKFGAEGINGAYRNKTIRLSRTFNKNNPDIKKYLSELRRGRTIKVPSFFIRNYIHTDLACKAIMHFAKNYNDMPEIMNYGGDTYVTFHDLMCLISDAVFLSHELVLQREDDDAEETRRPRDCSMDLTLAHKFNMPIYPLGMSIECFKNERINA